MSAPAKHHATRKLIALLALALLGCIGWIAILQARLDRALSAAAPGETPAPTSPPHRPPPPPVSPASSDPAPASLVSLPERPGASPDALWDAPEHQAVLAAAARDTLAWRYDALWEKLGLAPELRERARRLLVERQLRALDLVRVGQAQGLPDAEIHALLDLADEQIEANLRLVLGPEADDAFQAHERQLGIRELLERYAREIGRAAAPLAPAQTESLLRLFAEQETPSAADLTSPPVDPLRRVLRGMGGAPAFDAPPRLTARTLEAARAVLDPAQLEVLAGLADSTPPESEARTRPD